MGLTISRVALTFVVTFSILKTSSPSPINNEFALQDRRVAIPVVQIGHTGTISATTISPDDRIVVSGGGDGTIRFWDRVEGTVINVIRAHSDGVRALSFSPDGKYVVSGGADKAVRVWSVPSGKLIRSMEGHSAPVGCVTFSSDGSLLASGSGSFAEVKNVSDNTVRVWETLTGKPLFTFRGHQARIESIAFNPQQTKLVSGSVDNTIRVWSLTDGKLALSIPTRAASSVAFSPDGITIASVAPKQMMFWNSETGQALRTFSREASNTEAVFTPDWSVVVWNGSPLEVRAVSDGRIIRTIREGVANISLSNDGLFLSSGGYGTLKVLDVKRGVVAFQFDRRPQFSTGLSFDRSGKRVAWGHGPDIYVWDTTKGEPQFLFKGDHSDPYSNAINEVAFSPDGEILASCSDSEVKTWSLKSGLLLRTLSKGADDELLGHQSLTFSPDGKFLAVAGEPTTYGIRILNPATGRVVKRFTVDVPPESEGLFNHVTRVLPGGDTPRIHSVAYSPDGSLLASGDSFGRTIIWSRSRGKKVREFPKHDANVNSVTFSPDGKRLASGSFDSTIKIWDVSTRRLIKSLEGHRAAVSSIKFSPDGQRLVSGSYDHTVRLWDAQSFTQLATLEDHTDIVTSVAFSPKDSVVVSSSMDARVDFWQVSSKALISTAMSFDDDTWIYFSPDGYFRSSPGGDKYLVWRVDDIIRSGASFAQTMMNRDVLLERYHGVRSQFIPPKQTYSPISEISNTPSIPLAEQKFKRTWQSHKFYALVIANQNHRFLSPIDTSLKDGEDITNVLERSYGFKVKLLRDASRQDIVDALSDYERVLDHDSSLLIYYSGHGTYVDEVEFAYWQPKDAREESRSNWISSDDIIQSLKLNRASHVLVVSDSCWAGGMFKGQQPERSGAEPIEELLKLMEEKSRTVIASGGLEPVNAKGEDGNSVFGAAFRDGLKKIPSGVFTADRLFYEYIVPVVRGQVRQTPEVNRILNSGDKNGRFIFVRR